MKCNKTKQNYLCTVLSHSVVSDSVTPWTVALQAPLSMGFYRQEYWSGLLFPFPEDLPALAGGFFTAKPPGSPILWCCYNIIY